MTLLPVLMLAAGLNVGTPAAPPATPAAQVRMDRLVAAIQPALRQRAVDKALTVGTRRLNAMLAHEFTATTRALAPSVHARHAAATLDRLIASQEPALRQRAVHRALEEASHGTDITLARRPAAVAVTRRSVPADRPARRSPPVETSPRRSK